MHAYIELCQVSRAALDANQLSHLTVMRELKDKKDSHNECSMMIRIVQLRAFSLSLQDESLIILWPFQSMFI